MKSIVMRGLFGMMVGLGLLFGFLLWLSGSPAEFVSGLRQSSSGDWWGYLLMAVGFFVVGLINGGLKAPLRALLLGICIAPVAIYLAYLLANYWIRIDYAHLVWVIPFFATVAASIPTIMSWFLKSMLARSTDP